MNDADLKALADLMVSSRGSNMPDYLKIRYRKLRKQWESEVSEFGTTAAQFAQRRMDEALRNARAQKQTLKES